MLRVRSLGVALAGAAVLATAAAGPALANRSSTGGARLGSKVLSGAQVSRLMRHQRVFLAAQRGQRLPRLFLNASAYRRYVERASGAKLNARLRPAAGSKLAHAAGYGYSVLARDYNGGGGTLTIQDGFALNDLTQFQFCTGAWFWRSCVNANDNTSWVDDHSSGGTMLYQHIFFAGSAYYVPAGWRVNIPYWFNDVASSVSVLP